MNGKYTGCTLPKFVMGSAEYGAPYGVGVSFRPARVSGEPISLALEDHRLGSEKWSSNVDRLLQP